MFFCQLTFVFYIYYDIISYSRGAGKVIKMKLNNKGQALVEFALILPIFIFMILASIDIGKIIYTKNNLQTKLDDAISYLEKDKTYEETVEYINKKAGYKIDMHIKYKDDGYATIKVIGNVDILTPGLNVILGNPTQVEETREVYYEKTKPLK